MVWIASLPQVFPPPPRPTKKPPALMPEAKDVPLGDRG
jgi:hypothetical protein